MQSAVVESNQTGSWEVVSRSAYRYYTANGSGGAVNGLKLVIGPEAYARIVAAGQDPLTAADIIVKDDADYYFEYDAQRRVMRCFRLMGSLFAELGTNTIRSDERSEVGSTAKQQMGVHEIHKGQHCGGALRSGLHC